MVDSILNSSKRKATGVDSGPEAKRFRPNFSDTITVVVGEEGELFTVHTATICQKSEFSASACKREWQEGKDKTVPLPDIRPKVFTLYVNWAYTGVLDVEIGDDLELVQDSPQSADDDHMIQKKKEVELWDLRQSNIIALYLAADFLLDEALKDRAIDGLLDTVGKTFKVEPALISEIWALTTTGSGLRRVILDTIISHSNGPNFIAIKRSDDRIPTEFFADIAERLLDVHGPATAVQPTLLRREHYYDRNTSHGSAVSEQGSLIATAYGVASRGVRMPYPARSPASVNTVRYRTLGEVEDPRTRKNIQHMRLVLTNSVQECFDALVKEKGDRRDAIAWLKETRETLRR
ncbi:hypothetical protein LTR56_001888 [Elasticomyces elasticus]|nr:hypothetical protein LTR56_001888 [Elasticomyces elasticus]KAK3668761.1 hypothetical protein LTR22_000241 [Elasticomyces elasticus]KAK4930601.1 hypothetical protein LTR49_003015 [Elasticomyces elasticus]KAK5757920.1 hypothetical protein LTS12_011959 [Elasticomyces elasticus]